MVNINGETIEYIFQTSDAALKVRQLIGVTYCSSVELSKRLNMCCKQIQNYGRKRCYMEHKSFTHQLLRLMSLFCVQLNLYYHDVCQLGFANELEGKAVSVSLSLPALGRAISS
ncbi:uncharacterized protein LOC128921837 [Zeugodacus cucurbitae]|uniref:uncharacterized protein LOC128921837 n=1 Tax=Zeugodacus cucurbitae TaxID=28588 RepID=UPI0023D9002D|nr:uncharacterized protein LOC128921837 [Zeugodacus cucurbitae]